MKKSFIGQGAAATVSPVRVPSVTVKQGFSGQGKSAQIKYVVGKPSTENIK